MTLSVIHSAPLVFLPPLTELVLIRIVVPPPPLTPPEHPDIASPVATASAATHVILMPQPPKQTFHAKSGVNVRFLRSSQTHSGITSNNSGHARGRRAVLSGNPPAGTQRGPPVRDRRPAPGAAQDQASMRIGSSS